MKMLQIPSEYLQKIRLQAEKEYPAECCGVILGPQDKPEALSHLISCRNAQDDYHRQDPAMFPRTSRNGFMLSPDELLEIHKRCRLENLSIRVIYHSHPDSEASLSEEDRRMAAPDGVPSWPGTAYLVVQVRERKAGEASLFLWDPGLKDFKKIL
jgi:[CysO sulfur-carrier protein]-S-L-cysteine hydrolase